MQDQAFLGPGGWARRTGRGWRGRSLPGDPVAAPRPRPGRGEPGPRPRARAAAHVRRRRGLRWPRGRLDADPRLHARVAHRPPRGMVYSREESFVGHVHRHPARMRYEHGATRDGQLVYVRAEIQLDGGAYASSSTAVIGNAACFACGPYDVPSATIDAVVRLHQQPALRSDARLRCRAGRLRPRVPDGPPRRGLWAEPAGDPPAQRHGDRLADADRPDRDRPGPGH